MSRITWIRLFTLLFGIFISLIIWGADSNSLPDWINTIYHYPNGDKAGHFGLYGILALLLILSFPKFFWRFLSIRLPVSSLLLAVFAVIEEYSQSFFPSRTASALDLAFSLLGIFLFSLLAKWIVKRSHLA